MITEREKALWKMLDDIDTASDAFHPNKTPYYEFVAKTVAKRFELLASDGYTLSELVHASDCAVHRMPAFPNGPCDCGFNPNKGEKR